MNIYNIASINSTTINGTSYMYPFNPVLVMPSAVKSFKILLKHSF